MAAARKPTHTCSGRVCFAHYQLPFPMMHSLPLVPHRFWWWSPNKPQFFRSIILPWSKVLRCSPNDEILAKAAAVKHIPIAKLDNWGPVHGNTHHQTSSSEYTCRISWRKLKDTRSIWVFISLDNSVVSSHGRPSRKATIALQLTNTAKMIRSSRTYGRAYQKPRAEKELSLPSKVQMETCCAASWEVPFECHALAFFGHWQHSVHVSFSESSWSCGPLGPRAISIHISNLTVPGMLAAWKHCHGLDWHPQSHLSWEHLVSISLGISRERWNFIGIPTEIANVSVPSALPKGHIQPSFARLPIRTWNIQPQSRVNTSKGNAACTSVQYGVACPWAQNSWIALLYCHSYYPGTVPQNHAPPLSPKLKLSRPATLYQKANDFNSSLRVSITFTPHTANFKSGAYGIAMHSHASHSLSFAEKRNIPNHIALCLGGHS